MSDFKQPTIDLEPSFEYLIENLPLNLDGLAKFFITLINQFPEGKEKEINFDKWSLQDMLSHLIGWNILTITDLKLLAEGKAEQISPWMPEEAIDDFNATEVELRKERYFADVKAELATSFDDLVTAYTSLNSDQWGSQLGPNPARPIDAIQVDIEHVQKHMTEILDFYKKLHNNLQTES